MQRQEPIALFGQSGALFLLKQVGSRATRRDVLALMDEKYPGAMSAEMLNKGLHKLYINGVIDRERSKAKYGQPSVFYYVVKA